MLSVSLLSLSVLSVLSLLPLLPLLPLLSLSPLVLLLSSLICSASFAAVSSVPCVEGPGSLPPAAADAPSGDPALGLTVLLRMLSSRLSPMGVS